MQVLIVMMHEVRMESYHLPMGVGHISANIKQAGHEVRVLNPNHSTEDLIPQLLKAIAEFQPQVIALGGMSFHLSQIRNIVVTSRPMLPHAVIIVGGVVVSNHPQVTMQALPEADIGVVGEGERTIVELLTALESGTNLAAINGIIYWDIGRKLRQTAPRPMEKNLDALPWIDWEGVGLDTYAGLHKPVEMAPGLIVDPKARVMPFLSSRGCPFSCTFCCHELLGRRYRSRDLDDVFAELEFAIDRFGIDTVAILDDVFSLKPQRLHDFCARVRPLGLRWECSLRVEQVTVDNIKMMRDSGCVCVSFGVESMSAPVLENMKKSTTKEALDNALAIMYEAKVTTWANLIFGDPAETMDTALESLEWWAENNKYDLRTAFIGYHPGSTIYADAVAKGLIADPKEFLLANIPEINGSQMTDQEYATLKNVIVPEYITSFAMPGAIMELQNIGNDLFSMRSVCPHCCREQFFSDLKLIVYSLNRVACMHCNQLQRIPVKFTRRTAVEFQQLVQKLQNLLQTNGNKIPLGQTSEVFALCQSINGIDAGIDLTWIVMLDILDYYKKEQEAIALLKQAIKANPYTVQFFDNIANRLQKLHRQKESVKYVRQAELLRRLGVTQPYNLEVT